MKSSIVSSFLSRFLCDTTTLQGLTSNRLHFLGGVSVLNNMRGDVCFLLWSNPMKNAKTSNKTILRKKIICVSEFHHTSSSCCKYSATKQLHVFSFFQKIHNAFFGGKWKKIEYKMSVTIFYRQLNIRAFHKLLDFTGAFGKVTKRNMRVQRYPQGNSHSRFKDEVSVTETRWTNTLFADNRKNNKILSSLYFKYNQNVFSC